MLGRSSELRSKRHLCQSDHRCASDFHSAHRRTQNDNHGLPALPPYPFSIHVAFVTTTTTLIIIIIIIIIINCIESAIRDLLQLPGCAANCLQHVRSSGQGAIVCKSRATHRAVIACNMSCAMWYEGTARLLTSTELKSH